MTKLETTTEPTSNRIEAIIGNSASSPKIAPYTNAKKAQMANATMAWISIDEKNFEREFKKTFIVTHSFFVITIYSR